MQKDAFTNTTNHCYINDTSIKYLRCIINGNDTTILGNKALLRYFRNLTTQQLMKLQIF